ncbi:FAD dependent oxidoreductase [Fusarium albosuccineum]|uniref:FAD dependent oxidoreductase n=1 Tax=Fusarium albosuccineum TaxID=1237068 RepID=A0A8H4PGZ3_9HYPO|nr:FAD dependent oxidoreductase [Fusarium albosuccineum]
MKPSLPNTPSSLSHWHRTTRSFPYLHANHSVDVPISSRYVAIGSGLSGALTAYHLLERGVPGRAILILEAREAVSGASGINAGHVRPGKPSFIHDRLHVSSANHDMDAFRGFPVFSARHGPEQARKILESEKMVLEIVKTFVEENKVDCDFLYRTTMDVCLSKEFATYQLKAMESYKAAGGDTSHVQVYRGQEAQAKTGMSNAVSAYEWPAASNHPGKLCQWILSAVLAKGVKLWTDCPAIKISKNRGSELRWDVETPRGTVSADTIVHCTNAHAAVLLPQLASFITPHRSQAYAFIPTYLCAFSGHDERITQNSQREFEDLAASRGVSSLRPGEGLDHVWAGILGMTFDNVPLIGPIDGLDGQWICAGFNGHGMARIFACAPGLVKLMFGEEWADTGLPECFQFSRERINMCLREAEKSVL